MRERINSRDIVTNLRHELHRVLAYITREAEEIDPNVSTKRINLDSSASKIVGATVILDNFLQMITGVYAVEPDRTTATQSVARPLFLWKTIDRLLKTYSLIKNTRRAEELDISNAVPNGLFTRVLPSTIENLFAILCDNIWKYSNPQTKVSVIGLTRTDKLVDLVFTNLGRSVPQPDSIFLKGYQADKNSEGFGFGLYWAQNLVSYYNESTKRVSDPLSLVYQQDLIGGGTYKHSFTIRNIAVGE